MKYKYSLPEKERLNYHALLSDSDPSLEDRASYYFAKSRYNLNIFSMLSGKDRSRFSKKGIKAAIEYNKLFEELNSRPQSKTA